jgi:hypothetical protein
MLEKQNRIALIAVAGDQAIEIEHLYTRLMNSATVKTNEAIAA